MVETEIIDKVGYITLNNTRNLNALSEELCAEIDAAIWSYYHADCVCLVLRAHCRNGVWSAGHDIRELPLDGHDPLSYAVPLEKLLRAVQNVPIPVIAYLNGSVWGGACDLSLSCDMIVAADTTTFAITPAKIGIPYNASGLMHFINQLGMNKAREMFFTASPLSAQEALNVGMVNYIAPEEELHDLMEQKLLAPLRRNSILSISAMKRQFRLLSRSMAQISAEDFERINSWRSQVYHSEDYREGITSFIEKRPPQYKGSASDLDINIQLTD